jgi:hypothetical protein
MVEKSGFCKLPENLIRDYEKFVDSKTDVPIQYRVMAKLIFKTLGESGLMPYHTTLYTCPKCGTPLSPPKKDSRIRGEMRNE